ncbi:hypothetical protein [Streptomyces violaceusniger]|uniref:Uncharacterized protein n=1 Tax=Streptomyces violaceusniger TaxID=68280 RepID=A0A4D4LEK2_STRVO|nr:hypothetical protein SVIO_106640 [Streptomyces violaceusniger]
MGRARRRARQRTAEHPLTTQLAQLRAARADTWIPPRTGEPRHGIGEFPDAVDRPDDPG